MKSVTAAHVAALLAWRVFHVGDRVGAVVFNDSQVRRISPHRSRRRVLEVLGVIAAARAYASRTRGIILQNLVWAAGYNLGAVPAAAAGLIPPWAAAIGMSLSSLIVVANSLRLRSRAEPRQSRYLAGFADREPAA